ncbi:hypothetical protein BDW74DRAFT_181996 [Aspergillus multicolor]|uniref:uncharacterized protein n=1 Tax=Aspergillus multicolor TaxID=41759 RepID=UPI003CCE29E5
MQSITSCSACLDRGTICDGNPTGCNPCIRGGFICRKDYRDCPVIPQADWTETQTTAAVSAILNTEITTTHAPLITALTTFYNTLISMQYLRESELVRPPHVSQQINTQTLISAGFEAPTIALILSLPHVNIPRVADTEIDITPDATLPFPYLNLGNIRTPRGPHDSPARDPFHHGQDDPDSATGRQDWRIPPWTLFITRPDPQRCYGFRHCRIYDLRGRTLGLWSDAMVPGRAGDGNGRLLIDARPADEVIGQWTASLRSLHWVPSLSEGERTIQGFPDMDLVNRAIAHAENMPGEWGSGMLRGERRKVNGYWAARGIYEECGWPDNLQSEELGRRKEEGNETVARLQARRFQGGQEELDEYFRGLAGENAI